MLARPSENIKRLMIYNMETLLDPLFHPVDSDSSKAIHRFSDFTDVLYLQTQTAPSIKARYCCCDEVTEDQLIPIDNSITQVHSSLLLFTTADRGFKRQLMFQDVTAKYCIYDKVPSLPMSFFVRIKGCVNFCTTTSVYTKRVLTS